MSEKVFSSYAAALFSLAKEEKKLSEYSSALSEVGKNLKDNSDYSAILYSYAIPKEEKYALIKKVYSGFGLPSLVGFLSVLADHHLFPYFEKVEREYVRMSNDALGIKEGIVYSPTLLDADSLHSIEEALGKKLSSEVHLDNRVDKGLLGGVKVALDGKLYDGSLETKLETLRLRLLSKEGI